MTGTSGDSVAPATRDDWSWGDRIGAWPIEARAGATFVATAVLYPLIGRLLPGGDERDGSWVSAAVAGVTFGLVFVTATEVVGRREHRAFDACTLEQRRSIRCCLRTGNVPDDPGVDAALVLLVARRRQQHGFAIPAALIAAMIGAAWLVVGITRPSLEFAAWGVLATAFAVWTVMRSRRTEPRLDSIVSTLRRRHAADGDGLEPTQ